MSTADRAAEIRARLNAAGTGIWDGSECVAQHDTRWRTSQEPGDINGYGEYVVSTARGDGHVASVPIWGRADLIANAPADLDWLLGQLEAAQARAAAAEARLEVAQTEADVLVREPRVRALRPGERPRGTGPCPVGPIGPDASGEALPDFGARFPETDEHCHINDEAAARLLSED